MKSKKPKQMQKLYHRASRIVNSARPMLKSVFSPHFIYVIMQLLVTLLFKPPPPPKQIQRPYGRIAVIGAGLTGISSAAHAISHGFEVVIYEASDRPGGIWTRENKTSALQLNSIIYRFHPAVVWRRFFPSRDEILDQVEKVWKEYRLEERTRLNAPVMEVKRKPRSGPGSVSGEPSDASPSQWFINGGEDGPFDAIIVTVGTCGEINWVPFDGLPDAFSQKRTQVGELRPKDIQSAEEQQATADSDSSSSKGTPDSTAQKARKQRRKNRNKVARDASKVVDQPIGQPTVQPTLRGNGSPAAVDNVPKTPERVDEHGAEDITLVGSSSESSLNSKATDADTFQGAVLHSCELDHATEDMVRGKTVIVVGSGASGVEAVETMLERGAKHCIMLARSDKWIIPRSVIFDVALGIQPFWRHIPLRSIWEWYLRTYQYHGVEALIPRDKSIYSDSPIVNDAFLNHVRAGRCTYVRGETVCFTQHGALVYMYDYADDHEEEIAADVVVLATGYKKPNFSFLPKGLFPAGYDGPNLYLQNFSTEDWSCLMTNSTYVNAMGTAGHAHIGVCTRILLMLLLDPSARPSQEGMKRWVDAKRSASGGGLNFFSYGELTLWLVLFMCTHLSRIRWLFFVLPGWGVHADDGSLYPSRSTEKGEA